MTRSEESIERSTNTDTHSFFIYYVMKKCIKKLNFTDEEFLPSLEKQMEYILSTFDFEHVDKIMQMSVRKDPYTNEYGPWKIVNERGFSIPTLKDLKDCAKHLMKSAIVNDEDVYITRSGPFRVIKAYDRLILDFVMTTASYD